MFFDNNCLLSRCSLSRCSFTRCLLSKCAFTRCSLSLIFSIGYDYGARGGKSLDVFIEDLNVPDVNIYGVQEINEVMHWVKLSPPPPPLPLNDDERLEVLHPITQITPI